MSRADLKIGERGFAEYGEGETGEETWRACESSIAGDPRCWLFLHRKGAPEDDPGGSLHLSVEQVQQLVSHLEDAIDPDQIIMVGGGNCTYGMRWEVTGGSACSGPSKLVVHGKYQGSDVEHRGSLTLTEEVVRDVVRALRRFLEDAADPEHWKNAPSYQETWRQPDSKELSLGSLIEEVCEELALGNMDDARGTHVLKGNFARALIAACVEWPKILENPEFGGSLEDLVCDELELNRAEFKQLFPDGAKKAE